MSTEARFAAGDWYAVVGDEVTVLLPGSQRGRVAAIWDLADSGSGADAVLDALLAGGLSSLDHVALVAHGDDATRLIVRGAPSATISTTGGEEIVSAAPGTAWAERLVTGVTSLRITLTGDGVADLPLTSGIARVSVVVLGAPVTGDAAAPASFAPVEQPVEQPVDVPAEEPVTEPVAETVDEEPVVEQPEPVAYADPLSDPVPGEPVAAPGLVPGFVPEAAPVPSAPMSFGEPGDDPTPTGETPVVEEPWSEHDGHTQAGAPIPDFVRPPIPGQEMAPDVVSQPVASLVFSTGDVVLVDRTVLVGRAPEARRFASHDQPHVVSVPSPQQEISSTHLEIRPGAGADHGSAIATDLGSTNGTVLAQPGLDPEELKPGIAVSLVPGAVLDLGDGVTIQVTNP
ncbi:hypothetical protein SAMN04489844_2306 [Nocardioides exalbidus]|uniref:FHA domain-containing protein n=1 Tax=Nocardioides exalbidus TaxID=402596 RepID=A0A1H4SK06_9ACTN|nr:FHA domain-containing protein [Nocardioides exalbidus]SEC44354.1 hypothetical protein SAMN04489844_2306 [Nocardioides exalbidus]